MSVKTFRERVELKVQDTAHVIGKADVQTIIVHALVVFSKDCPIINAEEIAGDGGFDYALPTGWIDGFSIIKNIEHPAGQQVPLNLEPEDYRIYDNATVKKIRFLVNSPGTSETFIASYTIPFTEATIDTIPATHTDAFCELAASLVCEAISNFYGQVSNPSMELDAIDYGGRSGQWATLAKTHRDKYDDFLGRQDGAKAASVTGDWDSRRSWQDRDGLTHPNRER